MSESTLDRFLSAIERTEVRSLTWGYVDGSLAYEELAALFVGAGCGNPEEFDQALDLMIERALILKGWAAGSAVYRSRFAETVRLLVHLRQVTPSKPWDVAPDLVSDYRVTTGPRRVPKRVLGHAEVIAEWSMCRRWDLPREEAARAYLDGMESGLSQFQLDVGKAIFDGEGRDTGVVVTAGTGAGKTLAYYLPVAIEVAQLVSPGSHWTKSVSLYPRIELLKDQMSEVFRVVAQVRPPGKENRPIRIGALFDRVTNEAADVPSRWRPTKRGYLCPFLKCPQCDGELMWAEADLKVGLEVLRCTRCRIEIGSHGEVGLTRRSLKERPPDLLFVSAEMVNQRLSDPSFRAVLGLTPKQEHKARYLLLDEIHTYGGTTGAQVAGVIRRYRHAVGGPLFVVGLSATLRDAKEFLAELTGVAPQACLEVAPVEEDLESLSGSYQLILKANSSNRTSVLSTTIQASFLLARMLDSERAELTSEGFYGSRAFVFLDTLDVTNRLYDDLRDAEGVLQAKHPPLASLRPRLAPGEPRRRDDEGQVWEAPEHIHGNLAVPIPISRTSSQDAGVDSRSDVVIATPSLEVGFNDPRVGAVIQHRGPRDLATFVQRRGRAGRSVTMRPWMVTVLSEYGRDRLFFQLYEQLFDPTLPARHLPIHNRYVLRIQATLSTVDWLAGQVVGSSPMWYALSGPTEPTRLSKTQQAVLGVLDRLTAGDQRLQASLSRHLRGALQVDERELNALFWLPPRSLFAEVLPTLRRRLATAWRTPPGELDHHENWHPLPDFTPRALFQDLLVPEVRLQVPTGGKTAEVDERLPVAQVLREFAPGRVSRRLAAHNPLVSHWVEPQPSISLDAWMPQREMAGTVEVDGEQLPLYRPWQVATSQVPWGVSKTSFGALAWQTTMEPAGDGASLRLPAQSPVASPFEVFDFYLHSRRNPVTVTRFATQSHASVVKVRGPTTSVVSTFTGPDGARVAVGFVHDVDGIRVRLNVPPAEALSAAAVAPGASVWRTAFLRHQIAHDSVLSAIANSFELSWIADAVVLAVTCAALDEADLDPLATVLSDPWGAFRKSIELMHEAGVGPEDDELAAGPTDEEKSNLTARLLAFVDEAAFLDGLTRHLGEAADGSSPALGLWARSEYIGAAGAILLAAASSLLPNRAGTETLIVDQFDDGDTADIWITETTLGGGGVVEAVAEAFAFDPWRFVRGLEAAIGLSDEELLSDALARSVDMISGVRQLADLGARVRLASGHDDRVIALRELAAELTRRGVGVDQSLLVALNQRVFRIGTDARLDPMLQHLHQTRERVAGVSGFWADLRLFSIAAGASEAVAREIRPLVTDWRGGAAVDDRTLGTAIMATLWPAAVDVRSSSLERYNPFAASGSFDPEWVRRFCSVYESPIPLATANWREQVMASLEERGVALLSSPSEEARRLRDVCQGLVATPIDLGYLRVYPALAAVVSDAGGLLARFEVRELG